MSLEDTCSGCQGAGYHVCRACPCSSCNASGKVTVKCQKCDNGRVPCQSCGASGRVLLKRTWFSEKHGDCRLCLGTGKGRCFACDSGIVTSQCPTCNGSKHLPGCSSCSGTQRIPCSNCGGKGRVESEWLKSLPGLPLDRLKYEHEKRRSQISDLRSEMSELYAENEKWREQYEEDKADAEARGGLRSFFEQGDSNAGIWDAIGKVDKKIDRIQEEMAAIDKELQEKWK